MQARVRNTSTDTTEARLRRLVGMLEDWAAWQRRFRPSIGFRSRSFAGAGAGATTFEDLCDETDAHTYLAIEAAVDDLLPAPRAAILRRYGIAAVFRFPRENYEQQLVEAHQVLLRSLRRRGVDIA